MSDDGTPPTPSAPAPPAAPTAPPADAPKPGILERIPGWAVPALLLGVPLLFALVAKLVPGFFDQVVWP
ncbi:MAG: hypothetical protein QOI63_1126, partial [Thermoplasmata archaeon]|nr:hypothetical protein [Thermoplasmata archaeon]